MAALSIVAALPLKAQTTLQFQIDLRAQMKDSVFVPKQSSIVLTGNQLPFSKTRTIPLRKSAQDDSLYTTTVRFPSLVNNKILRYSYIIRTREKAIEESSNRIVELGRSTQPLGIDYFDVFAN